MLYDTSKSFDENIKEGPFFKGPIATRMVPERTQWAKIFDYHVMSSLGVSACPMVANARGAKLASDLGYDVITWKTIRSTESQAHKFPHVAFITQSSISSFDEQLIATNTQLSRKNIACANSIGNASYNLEDTVQEIEQGVALLAPGQILISSIYGVGDSNKKLIDDFVVLASSVSQVGVHAIELNLSCPNVTGLLYKDAQRVYQLGKHVVKHVGALPVIIKVGLFDSDEQMQAVMQAAAKAGIRGIAGINTISMKVINNKGEPYFGQTRRYAGISGTLIAPFAISFIKKARTIIAQERLDLTILGGGGITNCDQIQTFFQSGADAIMMATGAMVNPFLAYEYHQSQIKKDRYAINEHKAGFNKATV